MNKLTALACLSDPYRILEIPYTASEEQIKQAFQKKMGETGGSDVIIAAYGQIRDPAGRRRFRWGSIWSYLKDPQQEVPSVEPSNIQAIIRELAFLTEWELGDDACLK
jgi:hypothetical protein